MDGSSNQRRSGAGILVVSPGGSVSEYALKFDFQASNNIAEYEALVAGLQLARELGADDLRIFSDSQLVVNQVSGDFQTKEHQLAAYLGYVKVLLQKFRSTTLTRIPHAENLKADALDRLATSTLDNLPGRPMVEVLLKPSITKTLKEVFPVATPSS